MHADSGLQMTYAMTPFLHLRKKGCGTSISTPQMSGGHAWLCQQDTLQAVWIVDIKDTNTALDCMIHAEAAEQTHVLLCAFRPPHRREHPVERPDVRHLDARLLKVLWQAARHVPIPARWPKCLLEKDDKKHVKVVDDKRLGSSSSVQRRLSQLLWYSAARAASRYGYCPYGVERTS